MTLDKCQLSHIVILLVFSVWEWWLGKTDKIAAGSSLELVFMMLAMVVSVIFLRGRKTNGK